MNALQFYRLLENPNENFNLQELEKVCWQFPYFVSAQMLYLLKLYNLSDKDFSEKLKQFSHIIPDRKYFFQHLKKNKKPIEFKLNEEKNIKEVAGIKNEVNEIPVIPQVVSKDAIHKEINKSIAESIVQKELLEIHPKIKEKAEEIKIEEKTLEQKSEIKETKSTLLETQINIPAEENTNYSNFTGSLSTLLKQATKENTSQTSTQNTESHPNKDDKKERIKKQQDIIDKIISSPPKTSKTTTQKFFSAENKAKESLLETEDLVSETLAQIYAAQGNIHKAIRAYEILALKFPQKNTYFAAKIQELKNQLKKQ
ncbi:MAG: hypothetical protein KatS3mg027_1715 [Bacteroidia bacterium]|nr:MAG: hypothetical protein KatS3mg027_1715 [Bacteroidia bacterium]